MCGASVQEKLLAEQGGMMYNGRAVYPGVAQLVARVVWDHQAAGSNPVTRTKNRGSGRKTAAKTLVFAAV